MRPKVFLSAISLCSALLSLSHGIPMEKSDEGMNRMKLRLKSPYTLQEEKLIIAVLKTLNKYRLTVWCTIETEHKKKLDSNTDGFNQERTAESLRKHFTEVMMKDKGLAEVPKSVKNLCTIKMSPKFTTAEKNFIIDQLLHLLSISPPGTPVIDVDLWSKIADEINLKQEAGESGFKHVRTVEQLLRHYYNVIRRQKLIPEEVYQNTKTAWEAKRASSGEGPSTAKRPRSASQDERQEDLEFDAAMPEELTEAYAPIDLSSIEETAETEQDEIDWDSKSKELEDASDVFILPDISDTMFDF